MVKLFVVLQDYFGGREGTKKRMSSKSYLWGKVHYGDLNMAALKSNSENS